MNKKNNADLDSLYGKAPGNKGRQENYEEKKHRQDHIADLADVVRRQRMPPDEG